MSRDGIYRKFDVRRTDGRDGPGQKHCGCVYFVLDIHHDKHAAAALRAYADACESDLPDLATDCRALAEVNDHESGRVEHQAEYFPLPCYGAVLKIDAS